MNPKNRKPQENFTHPNKKFSLKKFLVIIFVLLLGFGMGYVYAEFRLNANNSSNYWDDCSLGCNGSLKPVIYLYPEKKTDVRVNLDYNGNFTSTFPEYDESIGGWNVTARPDGTLVNKADSKEYSYIFWDGIDNTKYDLSTGFVVKGSDTREFLQTKLAQIGLTPREYNEMIVFWLPKMEHNNYNLIHFSDEQYTETAKLKITPEPDSLLRVFMVFKPLDNPVDVKPQILQTFERKGFSVVEWGGTEVN